jgi:predicted nucleic acid-binding protein
LNFFFDSSALIKIYHYEHGSEEIVKIYNSDQTIFITELSKVEFLSAIHRKYREEIISESTLEILINRINFDIENRYTMLCFSTAVIETAADIIKKYNRKNFLRTLDVIQVSFFELHCEKDDLFVCFDDRLNQVLKENNYRIYDNQQQPGKPE